MRCLPVVARRRLAGVGLVAVLVTTGAAPVGAAPTTDLTLYANDAVVAPAGGLRTITVQALIGQRIPDSTLTIDRSAVDAFAVVEVPFRSCPESGPVIRCTGAAGPEAVVHISVSARPDAEAGREDRLTITFDTPDGGTATARPTITVGEGVNLVAQEEIVFSGPPGARHAAPLSVTNRGERTTHGAVLLVYGPYALAPDRRYRNCEYAEGPLANLGQTVFACAFPDVLEPGRSARVADGFALRYPRDVWAPDDQRGNAVWLTPADWDEFRSIARLGESLGPRGTAGVLRLVTDTPARMSDLPQTDLDPFDNITALYLHISGNQRADLAANGATGTGQVGRTVALSVGWTNRGPAAIAPFSSGTVYPRAVVTVPKGTTAVGVSESCRDTTDTPDQGWGKPGAAVYECSSFETLRPGERVRFAFHLRVDRAASLTGRVRLLHTRNGTDARDLNSANDTATILINPPSGGGNDGGGGNGGGGNGGGGGGNGGSLPITGEPVGLITGLGAVLLAAGCVILAVTRRRETRARA